MSNGRMSSLRAVLNGIRLANNGVTANQVADELGLGRSLVGQRVGELERLGLVEASGHAPSTGGRAARLFRHRPGDGVVAGIDIGTKEIVVALTDTAGGVARVEKHPTDLRRAPRAVRDDVINILADMTKLEPRPMLAAGVALPAPVEFTSGLPVKPPILPTWDRFPLRENLAAHFGVPVDIDNDVNLRLLAELRRSGRARSARNVLYFFVAAGVGVGLAVEGSIYRGANGAAGDIGHIKVPNGGVAICRCGSIGCFEAIVGSEAFERDGRILAESGQSPILAHVLAETGEVRALDITLAAEQDDRSALALYARNASLIGQTLSTLVSFFNPNLVIMGGAAVRGGDLLVEPIRTAVYADALPLTTQDLEIVVTDLEDGAALGGAHLALDRVFTSEVVTRLLGERTNSTQHGPG